MAVNPIDQGALRTVLLVLDLGTTTLAGRLLAADGTLLAEARVTNPQRLLGADILTRLQLAHEGRGGELQRLLVDGMRELIGALLTGAGLQAGVIGAAAAAGNPGISHLLCRLPVTSLIFPPHRSSMLELVTLPAADPDLGLPVPLQLFPAVSGFVGGDLLAVLYGAAGAVAPLRGSVVKVENQTAPLPLDDATTQPRNHATQPQAATLVLDLGTNAELALWTETQWLATSAAAGPAFEAADISCGMPLATGVITGVQLMGDRLELEVAGGGRPRGLCGSGLLELVAAAREGGLIDEGGRIVAPDEVATNLARYLAAAGPGWSLCCHRDAHGAICLAQDDVRQLQLAKGAVRAGVEVLLDRAGMSAADVARVLVTGAFGAALRQRALKGIAILPEGMLENLFSVPNGVLDGLTGYLRDPCGRPRLSALQATLKPFPLSGTPAFEKRFLGALKFG